MIDYCRRALPVAAAAYLALLPSNALSFWRSLAFASAAALALIAAWPRRREIRLALPGLAIPIAIAAWALWAAASLAWSIDPAFTARELKSDVLWSLATLAIFYVAGSTLAGYRLASGAGLACLAFWPALAIGLALSPTGWNARLAHMGVVAYSTTLVTLAPLLLLLAWPPPLGFREDRRAPWVGIGLLALVLVTARMSENRIVWIALAVSIVTLALALRPARAWGRIAIAAGTFVLAFALLFVDAARERAAINGAAQGSVAEALAADPRLDIWAHATRHIAERPWHGYGYGRLILKHELREDTGDYLVTHAHNVFVSQWLQTGGIGVALLVVMLAAFAIHYGRLVRTRDRVLARIGALGLAIIMGFVVKNLTDDFFFRANAKLFFAVNALLVGFAVQRQAQPSKVRTP